MVVSFDNYQNKYPLRYPVFSVDSTNLKRRKDKKPTQIKPSVTLAKKSTEWNMLYTYNIKFLKLLH